MIALFVVLCFAFPAMETSSVNLGGRCTQDSDCQIAYSTCQRGICACRSSFKAVGGLCTS
uniref:EB domain-containing protein n=1 Tax=Romanomermis culicivorax TaxID=13658 RepID=A0A915IT17_ROMCU